MRKGFSIFTPMIGTLVIMITMLIVSSIISSERISVQGTVQSYQSGELVNLANQIQSTIVEQVRSSITEQLQGSIETDDGTLIPKMGIQVNFCPSRSLLADAEAGENFNDYSNYFASTVPQCKWPNGVEGPCFCDEDSECTAREDACGAYAMHQAFLRAQVTLKGQDLLDSSINKTIRGIIRKGDIFDIRAYSSDFSGIVKKIGYLDCTVGSTLSSCTDGRMEITIDYETISHKPVAEVSAEGKRLQVYMPPEVRVYTTAEPYMQYSLLTAELFNDFQLLDNEWHGAGGVTDHLDDNYAITDGSEWYHYTYALQDRFSGGRDMVRYSNEYHDLFKAGGVGTAGFSPIIYTYFMDDIDNPTRTEHSLRTWIEDTLPGSFGRAMSPEEPEAVPRQALRYDSDFLSNKDGMQPLDSFIAGYATEQVGIGLPVVDLDSPPWDLYQTADESIYPGGCVELAPDADPANAGTQVCTRTGQATLNCLGIDDDWKIGGAKVESYEGETIFLNNTEEYDAKFDGSLLGSGERLETFVKKLKTNVEGTDIEAGFELEGTNLHFNVTVKSCQYYAEGFGFKGKDNFHCGQFMTLYESQPTMAQSELDAHYDDNACRTAREIWPKKAVGTSSEVCGEEGEPCLWFASLPIDYECDAKTLYRVEETFRVYRTTAQSAIPNQPVFGAVMKRQLRSYTNLVDDPSEADDELSKQLWINYGVGGSYDDMETWSGDIDSSDDKQSNRVRKCIYSYTTYGDKYEKNCEWVARGTGGC